MTQENRGLVEYDTSKNCSCRAGAALLSSAPDMGHAQGRADVLIAVVEQGPSSLDTHNPVANDYTRLVAWNVYDRLIKHGMKTLDIGTTARQ